MHTHLQKLHLTTFGIHSFRRRTQDKEKKTLSAWKPFKFYVFFKPRKIDEIKERKIVIVK